MPILHEFTENEHDILLHHWRVEDIDHLASLVAHLVLGRWAHIERILAGQDGVEQFYKESFIDTQLRELDSGPTPTDPKTTRRDGWLFQMMSWIVTHKEHPGSAIQAPHKQSADKNPDGLAIKVEGDRIKWILICEDKATDDPRGTITDEVWEEFESHERGDKDGILVSAAQTILAGKIQDVVAATSSEDWYGERRYRVSVATSAGKLPRRVHPFAKYNEKVPGVTERRTGNLHIHPDLRTFMNEFAIRVARKIQDLRPKTTCTTTEPEN